MKHWFPRSLVCHFGFFFPCCCTLKKVSLWSPHLFPFQIPSVSCGTFGSESPWQPTPSSVMYFCDQQVKKIKDPLDYLWVGKIPTFQGFSILKRAARPDSEWRHRTDGQSLNTPRPLGVHPLMEFGFTVHFKYRIQKPSSMKTEPSGNTVEESLQCLQKPWECGQMGDCTFIKYCLQFGGPDTSSSCNPTWWLCHPPQWPLYSSYFCARVCYHVGMGFIWLTI